VPEKRDTAKFVLIHRATAEASSSSSSSSSETFPDRAAGFYPGLTFFDFRATRFAGIDPGRNEPLPVHVREVLTFNRNCGSREVRCIHGSKTHAAFASASSV
jgi:hypothetical protein